MLKKQIIISVIGLILLAVLTLFGNTVAKKKNLTETTKNLSKQFDINGFIAESKKKLTPIQSDIVLKLEQSISRGDVKKQQIEAAYALANFWKDSVKAFEPYAHYISTASKLDNSEKNLTFAAQLFLANLRQEQDQAKLTWETEQAIDLFEKALKLNPENDQLKIGLGSCYIFGKGRYGGPNETMAGIQKVLEVVRKDSGNMEAQLVLGVGGAISGQYDKAIDRLLKVVKAQPQNLEAIAFLADSYAAKGEKQEAIKWYQLMKRLSADPHNVEEIDQRIKQLQ